KLIDKIDIDTGLSISSYTWNRERFIGYPLTCVDTTEKSRLFYNFCETICFDESFDVSESVCIVPNDFCVTCGKIDVLSFINDETIVTDEYFINAHLYDAYPIANKIEIVVVDRINNSIRRRIDGLNAFVFDNNLIFRELNKNQSTFSMKSISLETFETNWELSEELGDFSVSFHPRYHPVSNRFTCSSDGKAFIQDINIEKNESLIRVFDLNSGDQIDSYIIDCVANQLFVAGTKLIAQDWENGVLYCYELSDMDIEKKETDPSPIPEPVVLDPVILEFQMDRESYIIDGSERIIDAAPVIMNGRTLLPARYVTEPLGGDVGWEATEKKVVCTLGETTVEMWIGKPIAKINGEEVQIDPENPDVVPTIINDRTMVPMRFLAESLGCEVEWEAETKTVTITYHER
ncbi:MAG: copper amine oxidase N-terminal domain-containing protein, partial [Caldisericia bacterium]